MAMEDDCFILHRSCPKFLRRHAIRGACMVANEVFPRIFSTDIRNPLDRSFISYSEEHFGENKQLFMNYSPCFKSYQDLAFFCHLRMLHLSAHVAVSSPMVKMLFGCTILGMV